jgi:hypothetical protein
MPKFLEDKLRAEYGDNPHAIYGTMNKLGAMKGNKETAKGRRMEQKHEADMKKAAYHHTMITHHGDGSHTIEHHPHVKATKSAAFMERGEPESYSVNDGHDLVSKLKEHLGLEKGKPGGEADTEEAAKGEEMDHTEEVEARG